MSFFKITVLSLVAFCISAGQLYAESNSKEPLDQNERTIDGAEGIWLTKQGKSHLKIIECGKDLCNEVIWLQQPNDKKGKPHTDKLNKIKSLRTRPIIGLSILTNMKRVRKGFWVGRIYDPERGKSFSAKVKLISKTKLQVQGCLPLGPPFCKTHVWNKVRDLSKDDYKKYQDEASAKSI